MDHNEAIRNLYHVLIREAEHTREAATELESLVPLLREDEARQLAQLQVKASRKQAEDLRELAQKIKEK